MRNKIKKKSQEMRIKKQTEKITYLYFRELQNN